MKHPRLKCRVNHGDGEVVIPEEWRQLPAITRMDILQDWICDLQAAYLEARNDLFPPPRPKVEGRYSAAVNKLWRDAVIAASKLRK